MRCVARCRRGRPAYRQVGSGQGADDRGGGHRTARPGVAPRAAQPLVGEAKPFVLVVQPSIRIAIRKLVKTVLPDTPVMSFFEVPEDKSVEVVAVIGAPEAIPA